MIGYNKLPRHKMLCVDMKSFYVSCECVLRGLDPFTTYLAVIGDQEFSGSIVLSSSPKMKEDVIAYLKYHGTPIQRWKKIGLSRR